MKKFFLILYTFVFFTSGAVFAEGDLWDNFGDNNVYGQKAVSDEDFNNTIEKLKDKKYGKKRNKNIPKGESYRQSNETDFINEVEQELPILCIPTPLLVNEDIIPVGHYQIVGEKIEDEPVIKLYQSHYLIAQIAACETVNDFNKETINFVELIAEDNNKVKIIYGNVNFNAYAILDIAPEKTE